MINKKGDISITLLVIMTLSLTVASLFIFYFSKEKISEELKGPAILLNIYAKKEVLNFFIYDILRQSIIESYNEIATKQEYIQKGVPDCQINNKEVFCKVNLNLQSIFNQSVKNKFEKNFNSTYLKDIFLEEKIEIEGLENVFFNFDGKFFNLLIENITFLASSKEEIIVRHVFSIDYKIYFKELGILGFDEIYERVSTCQKISEQELKECLNFEEFDIKVEEKGEEENKYFDIIMKSKNFFFIDNDLKQIEINFAVRKKGF